MLSRLIKHEFALTYRNRAHVLYVVGFFVMLISIFPLSLAPEPELLTSVGLGVVWIALVLVVTLATDSAFDSDYTSGRLTQTMLLPASLASVALAKLVAIIIGYVVPLVLLSPFSMMLYHYEMADIVAVLPVLALGGVVLAVLGLLANTLLLGIKNGRLIGTVLLLPLYVPVVILGAGALASDEPSQHALLFVGLLFVLLPVSIYLMSLALKVAIQEE